MEIKIIDGELEWYEENKKIIFREKYIIIKSHSFEWDFLLIINKKSYEAYIL